MELRCGGPGSRVAYTSTSLHFAVEVSMMILCHRVTEATSGGPGQAQCQPGQPLLGGKASTPEGSSGGRPWVGLEAPRRFKPSYGPVSVTQAGGTSRPKMLVMLGTSSGKCYGYYPWKKPSQSLPPDQEKDLEMYEGADDQFPTPRLKHSDISYHPMSHSTYVLCIPICWQSPIRPVNINLPSALSSKQ